MAIMPETLELPYSRNVPLGLDSESWVRLEGMIPQQSTRFEVDFVYGQYVGANIALRLELRFGGLSSSSAILTLNSFADGQWGKEKTLKAPLRQGQRFNILFAVTSKGFKITQNGTFLCDFDHRLPPKMIRFLQMRGDVILKAVAVDWEMRR